MESTGTFVDDKMSYYRFVHPNLEIYNLDNKLRAYIFAPADEFSDVEETVFVSMFD